MIRARLFCPCGDLKVDHEFESEMTLGRGSENTLTLASDLLSSRHVRIDWDRELECFVLEDLGSSNGTRLDGRRVVGTELLGHLHVITLADRYDLVFQDLERCARRHGTTPTGAGAFDTTRLEPLPLTLPGSLRSASSTEDSDDRIHKTLLEKLPLPLPGFLRPPGSGSSHLPSSPPPSRPPAAAREASASGDRWSLEILEGGGVDDRLAVVEGEQLIGRAQDADLRIPSSEVSRHHARLTLREGRLTVRDLGSMNKTFVDEVEATGEVEITEASTLRFGGVQARLRAPRASDGKGARGSKDD